MDVESKARASIKPANAYSCVRCFDRKVKCSKETPSCAACQRHCVECIYRQPAAPRRRKKRTEEVLTQRIKHYEHLLKQNNVPVDEVQVQQEASKHDEAASEDRERSEHDSSPQRADPVDTIGRQFISSKLIFDQGRSHYLENNLWTRVTQEFGAPQEALVDSSEDEDGFEALPEDNTDFVMGCTPASMPTKGFHPPLDHISSLWQVFSDNVNPLCRIVHRPTFSLSVQKAVANLDTLPRNLEALMFSIYAAAIISLSDQECIDKYGEQRETLLPRYIMATKAALSRARFMSSSDIVVFQAFLLHLVSARELYDSRTLWILTGVAQRIAQALGLHRDGSGHGLPPFETEMRRRMYWLLMLLDSRSAELSGSSKFQNLPIDDSATKPPTSIDDDEINPKIKAIPPSRAGFTDMTFCSIRYEGVSYWTKKIIEGQKQGKDVSIFGNWKLMDSMDSIAERDKAVDELQSIVESKYARYCDPAEPIQLFSLLLARGAIKVMRLITHHPSRYEKDTDIPPSERRLLWSLTTSILKTDTLALSDRNLRRFAWHTVFYFPWQALIYVLDQLLAHPLMAEAEDAWKVVDDVYEYHPDFVTNVKKPIQVAIGTLCVKAYNAYENALAENGSPKRTTPQYIIELRQQRDQVKAKRSPRRSIHQSSSATPKSDGSQSIDAQAIQYSYPQPDVSSDYLQQPSSQFWYDDLGFQQNDPVDMDFMFSQGPSMADNSIPTDWAQWNFLLHGLKA